MIIPAYKIYHCLSRCYNSEFKDYQKNNNGSFSDFVEKKYGIAPNRDEDTYISVVDEQKYMIFLLKYS